MITPNDIQQMEERFDHNTKQPKMTPITCAYCCEPIVKTTQTRQFCTRTNARNCKEMFHSVVRLHRQPDENRTGQDPKLDPIKHKRAILNDLKTMTRKAVADKYGVHKSTLYNTLIRWGCHNAIVDTPSVTSKALTADDELLVEELYQTMTAEDIADKMEVSKSTIVNLLKGSDARIKLSSNIGADIISPNQIKSNNLDKRSRYILSLNSAPTYVMVPIDEYMRKMK